ncbi:fatty acid desaturase [Streptomyces sp. 4.24]|uniref:fatty acid desaturase n=1 Tax=Streptomyces tritrimontium TaxID=3406573 RepID=UPI003BB6C884
MLLALSLITAGILLRQPDRIHFGRNRPHTAAAAELIALQRSRATDWTPTLLIAGQWVQIAGYWALAAQGLLAAAAAAAGVAVQFRHLQEISHHAVHGVLARTRRVNETLAALGAHYPLGLAPVAVRRRRHVRDHHPAATLATDPNLAELAEAGLRPGATRRTFALALFFPATARGLAVTVSTLAANLRPQPGRYAAAPAVTLLLIAAYGTGGWSAVLAGVLLPRLLFYPLLAWASLIAEHTWFDAEPRTGSPAEIEAGRCLRLYPHNRALAALAAGTWLPYGDLYHYAHSAHPGLRWNYLPALDRHLPAPHFLAPALFAGPDSVTRRHRTALA